MTEQAGAHQGAALRERADGALGFRYSGKAELDVVQRFHLLDHVERMSIHVDPSNGTMSVVVVLGADASYSTRQMVLSMAKALEQSGELTSAF